jgi:hypothetical protein
VEYAKSLLLQTSRSSAIGLDVSGRLFEEHDGHSRDKLIIFVHKVFVSFRCDASTFYVNPEVTFITIEDSPSRRRNNNNIRLMTVNCRSLRSQQQENELTTLIDTYEPQTN